MQAEVRELLILDRMVLPLTSARSRAVPRALLPCPFPTLYLTGAPQGRAPLDPLPPSSCPREVRRWDQPVPWIFGAAAAPPCAVRLRLRGAPLLGWAPSLPPPRSAACCAPLHPHFSRAPSFPPPRPTGPGAFWRGASPEVGRLPIPTLQTPGRHGRRRPLARSQNKQHKAASFPGDSSQGDGGSGRRKWLSEPAQSSPADPAEGSAPQSPRERAGRLRRGHWQERTRVGRPRRRGSHLQRAVSAARATRPTPLRPAPAQPR